MKKLLLAVLTAVLYAPTLASQELSAADLDRRRKTLGDLLDQHWEYTLRNNPELASILGDRRYNDQVSDVSASRVRREQAETRAWLRRFEAIDPRGFSETERLNRDLMIRGLRQSLGWSRWRTWQMPVNQMSGVHLSAAQFPSLLSFQSIRDYEDYATRLTGFPKVLADTTANMRMGMANGLMPPRFLLEKVAEQAASIAATEAAKSPFAAPLQSIPATFTAEERERVRAQVLAAIDKHVRPGYARFAAFVRDEYAPRGRTEAGVWALPQGGELYAFMVRDQTTTEHTPEEIHRLGLSEVARIEGEMLEIAKRLGFGDLKTFNASLETNPALKPKSGDDIIRLYRRYIDQMYAKLPELFGRLPRAAVEVVPTPAFKEKEAGGAEYNTPAPDGSRPGRVYVNTYQATSRKTISFESTAYHEGVPGHHMQLAIQQELGELPEFRQQGGETAFVEGWALYSEGLGKEVGFYQDPYNDYGRLNDEMLRAIRLVVDTGLHAKRWTREQVVQYFRDHSAIDEVEIQSEADRYIVWPGQALAYKMGQLKILELRQRAQRELGPRFDIRSFHDEVLGAGAVPLRILEERIERWIARQKGA